MAEGEPAGAGEAQVSVEPRPGSGVRIEDRFDLRTFMVRPDRSVALPVVPYPTTSSGMGP